ncbi:MAG: ferredoxin family protein [Firmicutes bacterium]|nr:ferredoxin family protein [Bacillota bacterium]
MKRLSTEQLLSINKFSVDDEAKHIILDRQICGRCESKPCRFACPAGLYSIKDGEISFDPVGCLECGTCRVVCSHPGAITWQYPRGGFGVIYRYG